MRIKSLKWAAALAAGLLLMAASTPSWAQTPGVAYLADSGDAVLLDNASGANPPYTDNSSSGPGISVGLPGKGTPDNGLIEFNIDGSTLAGSTGLTIPTGATITSVTLDLYAGSCQGCAGNKGNTTVSGTVNLFTVDNGANDTWRRSTNGSGVTTFSGNGQGYPVNPGDANWTYSSYNGTAWSTQGGDYNPTAVATSTGTSVPICSATNDSPSSCLFAFTGSGASNAMVEDVQSWLAGGTNNGFELTNSGSVLVFFSAYGASAFGLPDLAPELVVDYTTPESSPVPEPASLTLAGLGLLSFAAKFRNRFARSSEHKSEV